MKVGIAQQMTDMFTGNITVVPTCTYLGTYSLSPSSCDGVVLTAGGNKGVRLASSSGNNVANAWFMSAVTSLDIPQKTGTIMLGNGSDDVLFVMEDGGNSNISLNIGNGTSLIPEAANPEDAEVTGFCSLVRLKDPSSGLYLSLDGCDSPTFGLTELNNSTTVFNVESVSQYELMPNHEEDAAVTSYLTDSEIQFFYQNPNSTSTDAVVFPENFAYVGLNESDMIISFVCPQSSVGGLTIEVQIGQVGGRIDPETGAALVVLDDVYWLVFGNIPGPNGDISIPKENGLKVVLGNVTGGTELTLPSAQTSDTPDNTAITAIVPAMTLEPVSNTTKTQLRLIKTLSETVLKVMQPNTEVFWALHMKAPQTAAPGEYQNFASSADQGVGEGGTAVVPTESLPTESLPTPAPASSGSNLQMSLILSVLVCVSFIV
jgi:hypothetical protein